MEFRFILCDLNDHKSDEEQDAPYCAIIVSQFCIRPGIH